MIGHDCYSLTIENNNGSENSSQVDSLREISKYYSVSNSLYYPVFAPLVHSTQIVLGSIMTFRDISSSHQLQAIFHSLL